MQDADWGVVTAYRILLKFSRVKVSESPLWAFQLRGLLLALVINWLTILGFYDSRFRGLTGHGGWVSSREDAVRC